MVVRAVLHPVGPLPASVYWLRRGVLLLVLAVVVVVIVLLASGGGHRAPAAGRGPAPVVPPASAASAIASATGSATGPAPTPTPDPTPTAPTACTAAALAVSVSADARTYAAGEVPRFTAVLRTTGPACSAAGPLSLQVTSGSDRVWDSADCGPTSAASTDLTAGGAQSAVRSWDRRRSTPGCSTAGGGTATAGNGTYRVVATWGGVSSAPAVFSLR